MLGVTATSFGKMPKDAKGPQDILRKNAEGCESLRVRDDRVSALSLSQRVRDNGEDATSLSWRVRDERLRALSLSRKVRDNEGGKRERRGG